MLGIRSDDEGLAVAFLGFIAICILLVVCAIFNQSDGILHAIGYRGVPVGIVQIDNITKAIFIGLGFLMAWGYWKS